MLGARCLKHQNLLTIFACVWLTSISAIAADQPVDIKLINEMRNNDVKWSGTYIGLLPTINNEQTKLILKSKGSTIPLLIDALKDERRIVIAHVLLSHMTERVFNGDGAWLFLKVNISADGKVDIDKNSYVAVREYWNNNPPQP